MGIEGIDHVAFPVSNASLTLEFYRRLGFEIVGEQEWRSGRAPSYAIVCGNNKINIHPEAMVARRGDPDYRRAPAAEPGCADLCFVWDGPITAAVEHLEKLGIPVEFGPVARVGGRAGGRGEGTSIYFRDPDQNLLEFLSY